jgi:hypothetical protein
VVRDSDDRLDLYCLKQGGSPPPDADRIAVNAQFSVALFFADHLDRDPQTRAYTLKPAKGTLAAKEEYCADEVFVDQVRGDWCSGVMLSDGRVLTVKHCVEDLPEYEPHKPRPLADLRFVFGFAMASHGQPTVFTFPEQDVCLPRDREPKFVGDLAFVEVACPTARDGAVVAAAPPSSVPSHDCYENTDGCVYAIGYPHALPAKFSGWAEVRLKDHLLKAPLDVMHGNSGSPVFDARHELVGVIDGERNFSHCYDHQNCNCKRWASCSTCEDPIIYPLERAQVPPM